MAFHYRRKHLPMTFMMIRIVIEAIFLQFRHPLTRRALATFACWALSSCRFKVIFKCRYAPESELKQERLCFVNRLRFSVIIWLYAETFTRKLAKLEPWRARVAVETSTKADKKGSQFTCHVPQFTGAWTRLWTSAHATGFVELSSSFKSCFVKIFDETRCECCRCSRSVPNANHKFRNVNRKWMRSWTEYRTNTGWKETFEMATLAENERGFVRLLNGACKSSKWR